MKAKNTRLPGCQMLELDVHSDLRGRFVKCFHKDIYAAYGLATDFVEDFFTFSMAGVVRGLHFQLPPCEHAKMVFCVEGHVLDAVVDLRVGSPTFGEYELFELDSEQARVLYLPVGLAHGYYVRSPQAVMLYKVTSVFSAEHDSGILWSSAGIPWPDTLPILSERDKWLPRFADFNSPFKFEGQ